VASGNLPFQKSPDLVSDQSQFMYPSCDLAQHVLSSWRNRRCTCRYGGLLFCWNSLQIFFFAPV